MSDNHPRIIFSVEVGEPVKVFDINSATRQFLNLDESIDAKEVAGFLSSSLIEDIRKLPEDYNKTLSYPYDGEHILEIKVLDRAARIYEGVLLKNVESSVEFEMLTSIFEMSDVGIIITNQKNRVVKVNPGFSRMFGWQKEAIVGLPYYEIIAPEDRDRIIKTHEKFIESNGRSTGEVSILDSNGNVANTLCTTLPLRHINNEKYLITTVVDITFRKKIEKSLKLAKERAESSSRAKSSFLAQMSHEFRTPLNAIIGFSEMMINETFGKLGHAKYNEYADDVHNSACHLLEIVNDVLNMSRIESGNVKINSEVTSIPELLKKVTGMVSTGSEDKRVNIEIDFPANLPRVNVDPRMIRQAFINIISNAYRHCGPDTRVNVSAKFNVQGDMVITVSDDGPGIPPNKLEDVLRPFGQVDDAFKTDGAGGTGLGLPITKGLIELHGGVFKIWSQMGQGTSIEMSFPERRIVNENQVNSEGKFIFNPMRSKEGVS